MDTKKIIAIEDDKLGTTIEQVALQYPNSSDVSEISIDMSPAFISVATQYFPNAAITFDKWHVIKLLYKHLDDLKTTTVPNAIKLRIYLILVARGT